ncbi:hypothetical protein DPMN_030788 [Dreissena polymorpha]|uniref:Uncharacterized protein n=1 Tax=Dreissena polymorpha TaxID=45954 RepID=A0A9D4M3A5_DREPO|nr:hypothetical protein DPMN_030788 [Dreissena polymorpha]
MRQNRISENGGGDRVLENSGSASSDDRLLYSDVVMIRPIVTSEASMKTTCDVNAAEITNCTSYMMNCTDFALKCTTSVESKAEWRNSNKRKGRKENLLAITYNTTYRKRKNIEIKEESKAEWRNSNKRKGRKENLKAITYNTTYRKRKNTKVKEESKIRSL